MEAVRDYHFPDTREMVPLTLDALKEMERQIVFVDVVGKEFSKICGIKSQYGMVRPEENCVHLFNGRNVYFASYGAWLAYAYPPAHIDREAWKPCGNCKPSCGNCIDGYADEEDYPITCRCCVNHNNYRPKDKYCSACGRPLKPEAWAELEQQLRG